MKPFVHCICIMLVTILFGHSALAGSEAQKVFTKVSPGVVFIETADGFGSGVIVKTSGLVLTNLHVVHGFDEVDVTISAVVRGKKKEITVTGVVRSAHPDYDAALVQLKLPKNTLIQRISSAKSAPATGANCYAIGNPGGAGKALRNSISTGIVSAAAQEIEGLEYIQTTAAINPGNSGGALVDAAGKLVGIVSFKASHGEGLGFAVPVRKLRPSEFNSSYLNRELWAENVTIFNTMSISGIVIMVVAGIGWLSGHIWFLVTAFRAGIGWGLTVLILGSWFPIINIVFLILAWEEAKKPFCVSLISIGVFAIGLAISMN